MFKSIGKNCNISPRASFYKPEMISIGDNVRIDDFCVISGGSGVEIGSNIHIACYSSIFGGSGVHISDFCQIAAYCLILSESDDFSGDSMIGPCIPMEFKPGYKAGKPITLGRHVTFGAKCTVFPGATIGHGAIFGAHSLINRDCEPWTLYAGSPIRKIRERSRKILDLEKQFSAQYPRYDLLSETPWVES